LFSGLLMVLPGIWAQGSQGVASLDVPAVSAPHSCTHFFAIVEMAVTDPLESSSESDLSESRLQHAIRVNRELFIVTGSVLAFLIACRLFLQWYTSTRHK
jgi:uncharacterized membrane protein